MNKAQIIDLVARKSKLPKRAVSDVVEIFLNQVIDVLSKGDKVTLSGFGTFKIQKIQSKTVRLPNSDTYVKIQPHRVVRFKSGKALERAVW